MITNDKIEMLKGKLEKVSARIAKDEKERSGLVAEIRKEERLESDKQLIAAGRLMEQSGLLGMDADTLQMVLEAGKEKLGIGVVDEKENDGEKQEGEEGV